MVSPKTLVSHRPGVQTYRKRQYSSEPVSLASCGIVCFIVPLGTSLKHSVLRRSGAAGGFQRNRPQLFMGEGGGRAGGGGARGAGLSFPVGDSAAPRVG